LEQNNLYNKVRQSKYKYKEKDLKDFSIKNINKEKDLK